MASHPQCYNPSCAPPEVFEKAERAERPDRRLHTCPGSVLKQSFRLRCGWAWRTRNSGLCPSEAHGRALERWGSPRFIPSCRTPRALHRHSGGEGGGRGGVASGVRLPPPAGCSSCGGRALASATTSSAGSHGSPRAGRTRCSGLQPAPPGRGATQGDGGPGPAVLHRGQFLSHRTPHSIFDCGMTRIGQGKEASSLIFSSSWPASLPLHHKQLNQYNFPFVP